MQHLPSKLYNVKTVVEIEQLCINQYGIPGYTLMRRAGQAVVDVIKKTFPVEKRILVLCGAGNNAGDGYVIARLAKQSGYSVKLLTLVDVKKLKGDALQAYQHWREYGDVELLTNEQVESGSFDVNYLQEADVVIDSLLGTGLTREVQGVWKTVIEALNFFRKNNALQKTISVDVPSGLNADTGYIAGATVQADYTVTFIGIKTGLLTGSGRSCVGQVIFDDLGVPDDVLLKCPADASLLNSLHKPILPARPADAHKGLFGHVLIVGGNISMAGAVILAARAVLRSGAGLVTVFTHASNVTTVTVACPEAMVVCSDDAIIPASLLSRVTHIAIGPGLGQDDWAKQCFTQCLQENKSLVIDADALNLLAKHKIKITTDCVLTPHPGEAASLLSTNTHGIAVNRFAAIKKLYQGYATKQAQSNHIACILKGSGTLVYNGERLSVCPYGNPVMATAGMGDVLTGIVIAMMAQGLKPMNAAECAVTAHGLAGDLAAKGLSRGMLASDVIEKLPMFL